MIQIIFGLYLYYKFFKGRVHTPCLFSLKGGCYGLNCTLPPNSCVGALTPEPQNVALFRQRVAADVISEDKATRAGGGGVGP